MRPYGEDTIAVTFVLEAFGVVTIESVALTVIGVVGAAWAVATDLRSARITNLNVVAIACACLLVRFASGGIGSVVWGALGGCVAAIFGALAYRSSRLGGGDVKFVAALGSVVGPVATLYFLACAMALAPITAILVASYLDRQISITRRTKAPLAPAISIAAGIGAAIAPSL
jgi:Flp pilus assembly protein protease CpaA